METMNSGSGSSGRDISALRAQVRDISDLAREYRAQIQLLTSELEDFRRREPLVQLLWHELVQVKSALEAAVAAGFSYDVGEPSGRYVDLSDVRGIADVNGLDVVRMMEATATRPGRANKAGRHSRTVSLRDDSGAAHAMLNDFIPVSLPLPAVEELPLPPASADPAVPLPPASPAQSIPAPPSAPFLSPIPSAPSSPPFVCAPDAPPAPPAPPAMDVPAAPPCAPCAPGAPDAPPCAPGAPAAPLLSLATKAVVVPAKKMKAVHWQRVLIGEKKGRAGGLWGEVADEDEPQLDYEELVGRFCDARASLVKQQKAVAGGKEKEEEKEATVEKEREVRVLSDKRYNTVSIMMTSLPPVPTVLTAIAQLDSTALSKDQVVALRKNMLDEAEMQQFAALPPNAHLSRPDAFMRQLAACDSISARLDCWHFQLHFAELQEEILTPLQAIHTAIAALRSSVAFRRFMGLILTAGNYMNGNTPRGQADGFELSVLARLGSLRDNDNHTTLLLWLLSQAAAQQGEVFLQQLEEELAAPAAAADFPLKQALSACSRFTALVRTMKNTATLVCASAVDASDPFVSVFAAFNAEADGKAAAVQTEAQEVQRAYAELLLWLNPTAAEGGGGMGGKGLMASEDLFMVVRELREVVRELRVERREEQEEAARAKRIDDAKRIAAEIKAQQQLKQQQQDADNASRISTSAPLGNTNGTAL